MIEEVQLQKTFESRKNSSKLSKLLEKNFWWMDLWPFIFSSKVSAVAQQVLWNCLIEDPSTVLRHFLEKLTISNRQVSSCSLSVASCERALHWKQARNFTELPGLSVSSEMQPIDAFYVMTNNIKIWYCSSDVSSNWFFQVCMVRCLVTQLSIFSIF